MMRLRLFSTAFSLAIGALSAQPIKTPYVFVQSGTDTLRSSILPEPPTSVARVSAKDGHFVIGGNNGQRIRFFGTELQWNSQFLTGAEAKVLAKRLHKLGFNAVRFLYNDYYSPSPWGWRIESFFSDTNGTKTSYGLNSIQQASFDTLLYEFKQQGIYAFLVMNSYHYYTTGDGIAQSDSALGSQFTHFIDKRAAELHRDYVKRFLSHVNPLTGLKLADDPVIAAVEVSSPGVSLLAGWRYGYINWTDNNNAYDKGAGTICWNHSRHLDTLYSQYLLHKYGSDAGINNAWKGGSVATAPNVIANGSFEQVGSAAWSFNVGNGAIGDKSIFTPAIDSQYCELVILAGLSSNPIWNDAYLTNTTARLGQDTLYELSFYAKIHYDPAKPVLSRPIYAYLAHYQTGAVSLSTAQTIDTTWKKYTFPFRSVSQGLQILYLGVGQSLGDVMFDGVSIKRKEEYGLFSGESSSISTIVRIKFGESDLLPHQRVRDQALFYDSLQTNYFMAMKKCIADTIKSPVLVNFYAPEYWGTMQDAYSNRSGDFTQAHINTDYPFQRDNGTPYSDSTWVMLNNSVLRDAGNYSMGYLASQSIAGKPFVARYMNLVTNQSAAAQVPFYVAYASLQDWDGLFYSNYATYTSDLTANAAMPGSWWSIAGDPSLLVQFPQASDAFRNEKIKASSAVDTITHITDDVLLESVPGKYQHPFGVEGYLDPNIITTDLVRQKFDSPIHKVAAEYPYLSGDTSTKISGTGELRWSQTGGYFMANANGFSVAAGIFGPDTVKSGNLKFRRLDNGGDMQSILLTQMPGEAFLLTAASRSQNSRAVWQYHDSSIGKHWGVAPTIMSAGKFEFYITSDSNRVIAHPLDSSGNIIGPSIEAIKTSGTTFMVSIDQSSSKSPWYFIESSNAVASVGGVAPMVSEVVVMPNPAQSEARVRVSLATSGRINITLYDDLGRVVSQIANGELYQGSYDLPVDVKELSAGHYTLRVECDGKVMSRSLNVVR